MSITLIRRELKKIVPEFVDGFIEEKDLPALREVVIETLLNMYPVDPELVVKVLCNEFLRPMGNNGPIYMIDFNWNKKNKEDGVNATLLFSNETEKTSHEPLIETSQEKPSEEKPKDPDEKIENTQAVVIPREFMKTFEHLKKLQKIPQPEQRTKQWFAMREGKITASDIATAMGESKYDAQYTVILKKCGLMPFVDNKYVHHGKKYETIASMLYEIRYNVKLLSFGLLPHPTCKFLGASPDNICSWRTMDDKFSELVGRMLEIKCVYSRELLTEGEIDGDLCPHHYWIQVQIQLACCDLEESDFWQCKITEMNREEFLADTDEKDDWKSKESGFEKGCIIQLLPKLKTCEGCNKNAEWSYAKFIYPPKIHMSPKECDEWIAKELSTLHEREQYEDFVLDKVLYWRFEQTTNCLIKRDREWYDKSLPIIEKMWNYVVFFRANKDMLTLLEKYIKSLKRKMNTDIMEIVEKMFTEKQACKREIEELIKNKPPKTEKRKISAREAYGFVDSEEPAEPAEPAEEETT